MRLAAKPGVGVLGTGGAGPSGFADFGLGDGVADADDHGRCILLMRPIRNRKDQRSDLRKTSLSPDQISSTAQTLTSTRPNGSATSRIVSSVMSVATFEAFLGQLTQMKPSRASRGSSRRSRHSSTARSV